MEIVSEYINLAVFKFKIVESKKFKIRSLPMVPDPEKVGPGFTIQVEQPKGRAFLTLNKFTIDPRWQKRRLEILARDGWECQRCNDVLTQLDVHHLIYRHGIAYWDYKDCELITLCHNCHEYETLHFEAAIKDYVYALRTSGLLSDEINTVVKAGFKMKRKGVFV